MIRVVHPGSGSRIRILIPDPDFLLSQIQGSKRLRIRNTWYIFPKKPVISEPDPRQELFYQKCKVILPISRDHFAWLDLRVGT
jgi:hypothetical protein